MTGVEALVVAFIVAFLLVAARSKPVKKLVGGIFIRDKKGRMTLVLTPTPKPGKKKRKR